MVNYMMTGGWKKLGKVLKDDVFFSVGAGFLVRGLTFPVSDFYGLKTPSVPSFTPFREYGISFERFT